MVAIVFPGQGSQKPGMGKELAETFPAAAQVFDEVSECLGLDLRALCWDTDEESLRETQNAQIALYTAGVAAWRTLQAERPQFVPDATAGHSVGEYAALTAAGVWTLAEGARLVRRRGELMARAGEVAPGTMAAVLGLDRAELESVCAETPGIVVVANDNCPGQLVISGEIEAVGLAGQAALTRGAKRVIPINVSGAFHSPLMDVPAAEMGKSLRDVTPQPGKFPVIANVTASPVADASEWGGLLEQQLKSPVRWTESIQGLLGQGLTTLIELGSGEVLSGLMKRIDKTVVTYRVQDQASLAETLAAL